jgi:Protein of unknown function (DUF998)
MLQKALLLGGLASSLVYAAVNMYVPMTWDDYSIASQTVSELSAIGSPTRTLWIGLIVPYMVLFAAFGWGVLKSAGANRWLRIEGWLILVYSAFNLYWPPMHRREVLAAGGGTLTDTLHLVWAGVTVFLFVLIMGFGAIALGRLFRVYTVVSVAALIVCGLMTSLDAPNVATNLPTPWIGVWERVNIGVFLLWVAVLSISLMRLEGDARYPAQDRRMKKAGSSAWRKENVDAAS